MRYGPTDQPTDQPTNQQTNRYCHSFRSDATKKINARFQTNTLPIFAEMPISSVWIYSPACLKTLKFRNISPRLWWLKTQWLIRLIIFSPRDIKANGRPIPRLLVARNISVNPSNLPLVRCDRFITLSTVIPPMFVDPMGLHINNKRFARRLISINAQLHYMSF